MIKWRFGLLVSILFLILLLKIISNNSFEPQPFSVKRNSRGVLQLPYTSTLHPGTLQETSENEVDFTDKYSIRSWMKEREELYRLRSKLVSSVCDEFNVSLNTSNSAITDYINKQTKHDKGHFVERISLHKFQISRPYQTMACLINKVASSSIVKTFLFLDGLDIRNLMSPHAFTSKLNPKSWDELKFAENHYTKFMIVREPMDRLASCYLDKMVSNTHWTLPFLRKKVMNFSKSKHNTTSTFASRRLRREISQFFKTKHRGQNSTGSEIVETDAEHRPLPPGSPIQKLAAKVQVPRKLKVYPKPEDIPTFSQFLRYILSTDLLGNEFESHWVPYWRQCTPCHFNYDVILKLETGEDDFTYLWKLTALDREVPIPWENRRRELTERENQLRELYRGVPRDLLLRVFRAYKLDYLMFGYDFNDVLRMAGYAPLD